jgi:3-oxoacyl-[acyl-carrier-protein] synthase II
MQGVCIGSGMGSLADIVEASQTITAKGSKRISPYFVPRILINLAAGHVSITHGFTGPNQAPATACAAGAHAIGDAMRWIQSGLCKVAVAGASEASICPLAIAGFSQFVKLI